MTTGEVAPWPSDGWVEQIAGAADFRPPVTGCTGTVAVMIGTGKRGARDVHYHWSYRDGVPGGGAVGPRPDADLAFTISPADAVEVASGAVSPSVAFMRGRLKATGDGALLLGFLASTATKDYEGWRSQHAAGLLDGAPEVLPGERGAPKTAKTARAAASTGSRRRSAPRAPAAD